MSFFKKFILVFGIWGVTSLAYAKIDPQTVHPQYVLYHHNY